MRSLATTLVAAGALGIASLASTAPAEAQYWHRCWNCGAGVAAGIVGSAIVANTCVQRQVVASPYGPVVRWVNVCY